MNLIILTDSDRRADNSFCLADHRADHIRTILKSGVGDTIEVGLLNGPQGRARVESVDPTQVVLHCEAWHDIPKLGPEIDLICALPRPQTFKKVLITSAMMGVRSLHLIRANRVEKSYFQSPLIHPEQQLSYLVEGLAQGRLTRLPLVRVHERFRQFFEDDLPLLSADASVKPLRLLCDSETNNRLDQVFDPAVKEVIVAVGPEGGWVPFELELMHELDFHSFTLGRWTLRVEHAVTAALSQIELLRMMSGE
jgi:16S rRNA (uracil1498-N3)-methyltransferase